MQSECFDDLAVRIKIFAFHVIKELPTSRVECHETTFRMHVLAMRLQMCRHLLNACGECNYLYGTATRISRTELEQLHRLLFLGLDDLFLIAIAQIQQLFDTITDAQSCGRNVMSQHGLRLCHFLYGSLTTFQIFRRFLIGNACFFTSIFRRFRRHNWCIFGKEIGRFRWQFAFGFQFLIAMVPFETFLFGFGPTKAELLMLVGVLWY